MSPASRDVILDQEGGRAGALAIVDYKVAGDEGHEERYTEQLRVYTLAGRGEELSVEAAYLHELRDGTRRPVEVSESACGSTVEQIRERLAGLRQGQFSPAPEARRCENCDYRKICKEETS